MIREVLRMGDPRLLRVAQPVTQFGTPELAELLQDMRETMAHLDGAGLAAPQIGVDLRVVIFGFQANPRYPEAAPIPETVLINLYVSSPGRSSYTTHYDLLSAADNTIQYGTGTAVMVWVDRNTGKSQPLPDYMRAVFDSANATAA